MLKLLVTVHIMLRVSTHGLTVWWNVFESPITTDVTVKVWDLNPEANKQIFIRILRIM
jgi:hypothetical protein